MLFHLTSEQKQLQDSIRRTLQSMSPAPRRLACEDGALRFSPTLWSALAKLGLSGIALPESTGGSGLGLLELALAAETLGYEAAPGPFLSHAVASLALPMTYARLPDIAMGTARAAFIAADLTFSDGALTGTARFALGAEDADVLVVATGDLVYRILPGAGVTIMPVNSADRTRPLAAVVFEGAAAEPLRQIAPQRLRDAAAVLIAADALGGAQCALDMAVDYAKTREQFGGPIARFQALKHQLADMALAVEPARALVWYAAYAWDADLPDASRVASLAKAHLADRFVDVTRAAIQAHGGIGYTWDYDLQIWFRRALFDRAFLGAPSEHRERAAQLAGW